MHESIIRADELEEIVFELVLRANTRLPKDVLSAISKAKETEDTKTPRLIFDIIKENARLAFSQGLPICQDTGIYVVFIQLGNETKVLGDINSAVNRGISRATKEGYLRASVCDPITRQNTFDNTPAIIHFEFIKGAGLKIFVLPKGCGSENMSALRMLPPSSGMKGVVDFVVNQVANAGPNPCPPGIVGIGIGGSLEQAAFLSKKALLRPLGLNNPDPQLADLEKDLLLRINELGIGPQGLGGKTTTLSVAIEKYHCHIASLPVAVNMQCHAARRAAAEFEDGEWKIFPQADHLKEISCGAISFDSAMHLKLPLQKEVVHNLRAGQWVLLSGRLLTGRDQTHRRLCQLINRGAELPVSLKGQLIYYMGPSPAPPGRPIGSAGPTTSYRMDAYTPDILAQGVLGLMGKGRRSDKVKTAIASHKAVYLATIGGAGAYLSEAIKKSKVVAFEDLGPEALYELEVEDFPAIVINDPEGNDYYDMVLKRTSS